VTAAHAPGARRSGAWAAQRRWRTPLLQALALLTILTVDVAVVTGARADLRADGGAGDVVATPAVERAVSPPVRLGIPELGITTRLIGLRKELSGALGVPEDPQQAGWYSQGPAPGDPGPAVIVGHVDSVSGPGIFASLRTLGKGAKIQVRRADGSLAVFVVTQVQQYAKRDFPTDVVYRGDGRSSLRLITCGGDFDRRAGSYRSNVVVYAEPA
jgi:hypothetical protein